MAVIAAQPPAVNYHALFSTFVAQRFQDCKGCDMEWNIYSIELEAAFEKHESKCRTRHGR